MPGAQINLSWRLRQLFQWAGVRRGPLRLCSVALQRICIWNNEGPPFGLNQSIVFQPGKGARNHISYRADAIGDLVVR